MPSANRSGKQQLNKELRRKYGRVRRRLTKSVTLQTCKKEQVSASARDSVREMKEDGTVSTVKQPRVPQIKVQN